MKIAKHFVTVGKRQAAEPEAGIGEANSVLASTFGRGACRGLSSVFMPRARDIQNLPIPRLFHRHAANPAGPKPGRIAGLQDEYVQINGGCRAARINRGLAK